MGYSETYTKSHYIPVVDVVVEVSKVRGDVPLFHITTSSQESPYLFTTDEVMAKNIGEKIVDDIEKGLGARDLNVLGLGRMAPLSGSPNVLALPRAMHCTKCHQGYAVGRKVVKHDAAYICPSCGKQLKEGYGTPPWGRRRKTRGGD